MDRLPQVIYASSMTRRDARRRRFRRRTRQWAFRLGDWVALASLTALAFVVAERFVG